jgi:flavin-dependent dehydrogenase
VTTETSIDIAVLGAGPAALALTIALRRMGLHPQVIGRPRPQPAVEGLSYRVAQGLQQLGCRKALSLLGEPWRRQSGWGGTQVEMNGEFVVQRQALDAALWEDARQAGVDLYAGLVRSVEHAGPGDWCIDWEGEKGRRHTTRARFVVESRGRAAPKWGADEIAAQPLVALTRSFSGAAPGRRTTFTESFEDGWMWGTLDADGTASVQLVLHPDTVKRHGGDLDATHAAGLRQLSAVTGLLGDALQAQGATSVRGIQAVLRANCCQPDGLRVGDAAYSSDPLSGHGMFEAVSGALAAAPTLRTLLQRPGDAQAACEFYTSRVRAIFMQRQRAARDHYATETRWSDAAFWRGMQAASIARDASPAAQAAEIVHRPVVENGFIVERRVVLTPAHPRGVRFIDGVDLPALHDVIGRTRDGSSAEQLSAQLGSPPAAVRNALHWMQAQRLI